jgi:4-alpha-glucanotransferase
MNKPGTANGNWQYRVTTEQLDKIDWNRFRSYNRLYGRSE